MKLHATLLATILLTLPAHAVVLTTTFTNLQGSSDSDSNLVFSDNTGTTITGGTGYVGIGTFNASNSAIANISTSAEMSASFHQFGAESVFGSFGGTFSAQATLDPDTEFLPATSFTGLNVYVVIGNQSTLASSTEFLVWDSGVAFANTDPSGSPDEVVLDIGSGNLVIGLDNQDAFDLTSVGGSQFQPAFTTVALVPEPSSTALLGLGGVAFLLRRRR